MSISLASRIGAVVPRDMRNVDYDRDLLAVDNLVEDDTSAAAVSRSGNSRSRATPLDDALTIVESHFQRPPVVLKDNNAASLGRVDAHATGRECPSVRKPGWSKWLSEDVNCGG